MTDRELVDVTVGIPTRNRSSLLRKAIGSVLEQSYARVTVIVSDNASEDDTARAVASFSDPRIVYRPVEQMISRPANFNRLIDLAETEFVLLLSDDDWLHPDHLSQTVAALKRWPTVGMAYSGYAIVDQLGNELVPHARCLNTKHPTVFEPGAKFVERTLRTGSTVCLASALFRKAAVVSGGGLQQEDGAIDDLFLMLRVGTAWDFAYVNRPLAVLRMHDETSSSSLGRRTAGGLRSARALPEILYENRQRFLSDADLPEVESRRLARIVERRHRQDVLSHLSMRSNTGDGRVVVLRALGTEITRDRRLLLEPATLRFVIGQVLGRRLRQGVRRMLESARAARLRPSR